MDLTIDAAVDSTKDIMSKLFQKAYGQDYPDGLYDFPAHTALNKCEQDESDLHVEWADYGDMDIEGVSDLEDYAPLIRTQEKGPSDNDPPFDWGGVENAFFGVFGSALKSLLKVVAVGKSQGDDMSNLILYFKRTWGLPDDTDLDKLIPNLRSTGPTMLAALNRKLVPFCYAHPAVSGLVKVKFHGVQRKGKLVNWPRITAIAQFVATMLKMEDTTVTKEVGRIDFKINWDEMPDEPVPKHFDFSKLKPPDRRQDSLSAIGLVNHLVREKQKIQDQYRFRQKANVTVEPDIPRIVLDRVKYVDVPLSHIKVELDWDNLTEEEPDIISVKKNPDLSAVKGKSLSNVQALEKIIAAKVFERPDMAGYQMHDMANKLEIDPEAPTVEAYNLVENSIGTNCLKNVYHILRASGDEFETAHEKAIGLLRLAGAKGDVFKESSYVAMQKLALGNRKVLAFFLRNLAQAANKHVLLHSNTLVMTRGIAKALKQHNDVQEAFRQIVEFRKNWWAHRWKAKGRVLGPKMVEYQLKGNWLAVARIEVTSEYKVQLADDGATVVSSIYRSVENFLRKRETNPRLKDEKPPAVFPNIDAYASLADKICNPAVSYAYVVSRFRKVFTLLTKDVREVCLSDPYGLKEVAIKGDMLEESQEEEHFASSITLPKDDDGPMCDEGDVVQENAQDEDVDDDNDDFMPKPVAKVKVATPEAGEEEDDEDDLFSARVSNVDLAAELYEDLDNPPSHVVPNMVELHGAIVNYKDYAGILLSARKMCMEYVLSNSKAANKFAQEDGDDIN